MNDPTDTFYEGIEAVESGLRQCLRAFVAAGGDIAEDRIAQILRRLEQDVSELHDRVETYGLVDSEDAV